MNRAALAATRLKQGKSLLAAGHLDAAIEQLLVSRQLSATPEVHFRLAEAYRAKGYAANALGAYRAYLAADPNGELAEEARIALADLAPPHPSTPRWQRIVERPLTLDERRLGINTGLAAVGGWYRARGQTQLTSEFATHLYVGAGYGITRYITVGGNYGGGTHHVARHDATGTRYIVQEADSGEADLYCVVSIAHGATYSVAANVLVSQNFEANEQMFGLGLMARYRFSRRLAVFTGGSPIAPTQSNKLWTVIGRTGTSGGTSASVALEFQATRRWYLQLASTGTYWFGSASYHQVSMSAQTFVTMNKHLDIGAYLGAGGFGLSAKIFY